MHWHFSFVPSMEIDACFKIGYIIKTHGLKGEVTLSLDDDGPEDLSNVHSVFVEKDKRLIPYFIQSFSHHGAKAFVKFEDVDNIEEAEKIVKHAVYLEKSARPKSARGEFYNDEIIQFNVLDETGKLLGSITEIMQAGPNKLIVMDHNGKEVLIPVNSPFITSINKTKKTVSVNLPEGFLDI
ncbi:MAG: 16S rRNA processing protein RimM [Marivirga sp.]|nr:16S rRNA processing protein RimM [Marivirga sp.]